MRIWLATTLCFLIHACLPAPMVARGEDWPQFRGPDGQGHGDAHGLPITWSETQNIAWKVSLPGRGWSSPVIRGEQIWMTAALDEGKSLRALSVDRTSGSLLHDVEVFTVDNPPPINAKNSYASPTPVIDELRVYVHFGTLGTACLATDSGRIEWTNRQLLLDHKEGAGSSPIVWGDLVIVNCDGTDVQYVAALNKHTGRLEWKTPRSGQKSENPDFRKAYSTPLVIEYAGAPQLVSPGADRVIAYDPASGQELWHVDYDGFSNVPRPLFGHGLLYVATGYNKPQLWAIRPGQRGDLTATNVAWRFTKQVPANPSPILVADALYMVSDQGVATCLDARSGKERWVKRLGGDFSASPVFADGRIYFSSEQGKTFVIEPAPTFKLLATNQLDGRILASAAIAGRAIYLRTETHLYRIE